jgi:hypothetical protein
VVATAGFPGAAEATVKAGGSSPGLLVAEIEADVAMTVGTGVWTS